MLTHRLRKEEVEEEPEFDIVILAAFHNMDITSTRAKENDNGSVLTSAEGQAWDDSFMAHIYGMPDFQLQIGGRPATSEECAQLNERLNAHA